MCLYQPQTTTRKGHGEKGIGCDQAVWLEDTKGSNKNEHRLLVKPTVLMSLSFGPVESESLSVRSNSL